MLYPLYDFQAKENKDNSNVTDITEKARFCIYDLNKTIYDLYSNYREIFNSNSILNTLKNLDLLHKETDKYLLSPDYSISVIGTTSSGKSTFINSLLGLRLSPMNSDELSVGSLTFSYINSTNNSANIDIKTEIANTLWDNGLFEENYEESYNRVKSVMEVYKENSDNKDISPPHINISSKNFLGNNPSFIGIDNNANIKLIELPWSIIDSESFDFIINEIKASFTVFVIDYTVLFHKETKETNTLLRKVLESKKGTGTDNSLVFVLNKVDLRNQDDENIDISIEKSRKEIVKRLGEELNINICTINSLLNYYMQLILTAYENGDLKSYNTDDNISEDKKQFINYIHKNLKNCFKDQAKSISELQELNDELYELIEKIKKLLKENKIPSFQDFYKLWNSALEYSGMNKFLEVLKSKSIDNLNSILLYKGLNKLLNENTNLIKMLEESISVCKNNDDEYINNEETHIKENFELIKNKILDEKNNLENIVQTSLNNLKRFDEKLQKESIKNLDIGNIEQIIPLMRRNVEKNTISALEKGIIEEIRPDKFSALLEKDFLWTKDFTNKIIDDFDFLRVKLYSERKYIDEGRKFELKQDDNYEKEKLDEIYKHFESICSVLNQVMNEKFKFLFQENIEEMTIRINNWLNKRLKELEDNINNLLKNLRNEYELNKYKPEFINTFNHNYDFISLLNIKPIQTIKKEEIIVDERPIKKAWYQFWVNEEQIEVIKETKEFLFYEPIRNQVTNWTLSLSKIEDDIWLMFCEILNAFFRTAINNYNEVVNKLLDNLNYIINQEFSNLDTIKYKTTRKWKNTDLLYEKLKDINTSLHHLSDIPYKE